MGCDGKPESYRRGYGKAEDKMRLWRFRVPEFRFAVIPRPHVPIPTSRVAAFGSMGYDVTSPK